MAEGWAKHLAKNDLEIWSSGLEGSRVHPTAKVSFCVLLSFFCLFFFFRAGYVRDVPASVRVVVWSCAVFLFCVFGAHTGCSPPCPPIIPPPPPSPEMSLHIGFVCTNHQNPTLHVPPPRTRSLLARRLSQRLNRF